jgi:Uma2 family endonuclease
MRHELVRGELRTMALNDAEHGAIVIHVAQPISQHVKTERLGAVFAGGTGFILARDPDTVRAPDIAFIKKAKLGKGIPKKFMPFAPDLVVEVVSPGDTFAEVEEKADDWLDSGATLVWVVNPQKGTVSIYRRDADVVRLSSSDVLDGGDVIKGFKLKISEIFI